MDGKSETFYYDLPVAGESLAAVLPSIVETALKRLPVAKMMRWAIVTRNSCARFTA